MKTVHLGEVCQQSRKSIKPGEREDLSYIGLESIESGTGQFAKGALSKTPEVPLANSFRFGPEHILYGKLRPYLNKVALPDFEGKCSTEIIPLLPNKEVDRAYLAYFLRSRRIVDLISARTAGARMPRAEMDFVFSLSLPLPPLPEQHRIVDLLSRAEGIVRLRREAEKKAAKLIPALFIDTFGDPTTNPKGWPVEKLSSACLINPRSSKDQRPAPNTLVSFVPMAAVDEHFGAITRTETRPYEAVSKGYTAFQSGDVLFAKITPCMENGKAAIADGLENGLGFGSTEFHVLRPTDKAHNAWLYGLVRRESFRHEAKRSFTGTAGQQRVPTEFLKELKVPIPPIRVQQGFNQALMQIRSIQNQQFAAIAKAQTTFDALLARVFSQ